MTDSEKFDEKRKNDITSLVPRWVKDMVGNMKSICEIDDIDDMVFALTPAQTAEMYAKLDMTQFSKFMQHHLATSKSSPLRLTSMLRLNGKPFTLVKHKFFEPLFYPNLPDRTLLACARQVGKMLCLTTAIPTPTGITTIGELRLGDQVLTPSGQPTNVTWLSAIATSPEAYKVSFNDGTSVVACADHQWQVARKLSVRVGSATTHPLITKICTTKQLLVEGVCYGGKKRNYRFSLPQVQPSEFPKADLAIDPYTLGVWLGDGHTASGRISGHVDDQAIKARISLSYTTGEFRVLPSRLAGYYTVFGLRTLLRTNKLLGTKHIPMQYLRGSIAQRTALLQGLMDTDGTCSNRGLCSLGFSDARLAQDALQLLNSLGFIVKCRTKQPNYTGSKLHHLMTFTARADKLQVFHLPRKLLRLKSTAQANGKPRQSICKKIIAIELSASVPMRCIQVAAPEHLYLCGLGWIPTHNSTHIAAQGVLQAAAIDRFKVLYMAPQFEQIRRFSHQYIRQFVHESYIKSMLMDDNCVDSVMQKSFKNGSELWFSFAKLSVDRIRGLSVDGIRVDEIQDLNPEFLDIVRECMSASERRSEMYAGTSKTIDNVIEQLRLQSSQAEWFMKCNACNHWNIPTIEGSGAGLGVLDMIRPDGLCCARCHQVLEPERGIWVHKHPERAGSFPGYHVPQVIAPVHYANAKNWRALLVKRELVSPATFINEVLGEACDEGQRLVSQTELKDVCVLRANSKDNASDSSKYADRVLGVDWGGKGSRFQSMTAAAVACYLPVEGKIDIIFGHVFQAMTDSVLEAKEVIDIANKFACTSIAHDVAVAGEVRLSIMRSIGIPDSRLINCRYTANSPTKSMLQYVAPTDVNPTSYYNLDKSRVIAAVCLGIKNKNIRFPQYDSMTDAAGENMMNHFLAVYEESAESVFGTEKRYIRRNPGMPDDFLHAVAFAVISLWRRYPELIPNLLEEVLDGDEHVNMGNPSAYYQGSEYD